MRSLEREYDAILRRELGCRAAWLPVTAQIAIGDYGVISRGTFNKIGNVASDFSIKLATSVGAPARLNFVSEGARVVRFAGGVQVPAFSGSLDVAARLDVNFSAASSFVLKSHAVTQRQLDNAGRVAREIGEQHREHWRFRKYYIVSKVLTGVDVVCISTRSADTTISFTGSAAALQQVDGIGAHAGVNVAWNKEVGLEVVGRSGPIGLHLFRVRWIDGAVAFAEDPDDPGDGYVEADAQDDDLGDTI